MSDVLIKYLVNCPVCGKNFHAKRKHAKTCSSRCRFILHQLNIDFKHYSARVDFEIIKVNDNEIKRKGEFVTNQKMRDHYGNPYNLIGGYCDSKGDLVRVIFRNKALKYLTTWNLVGDDIEEKFFKFS